MLNEPALTNERRKEEIRESIRTCGTFGLMEMKIKMIAGHAHANPYNQRFLWEVLKELEWRKHNGTL